MFDADIEDLLRRYQTTAEDRSAANAQGLLAAGLAMLGGQKGREWEAISRGGLLGLNARSNYLQDVEQRNRGQIGDMMKLTQYRQGQQEFDMRKQQFAAQQQEAQRKLAEAEEAKRRQLDEQQRLGAIFGGAPNLQNMGAGGPTPQNLERVAPPSPVNQYRQAAALMAARGNVEAAKKYAEIADKMEEEFSTTPVVGVDPVTRQPVFSQFGKKGTRKPVEGVAPPPEIMAVQLGDRTQLVDKLTAAPGMSFAVGQSPDSKASTAVQWSRLAFDKTKDAREQAREKDEKWVNDLDRGVQVSMTTGDTRPITENGKPIGLKKDAKLETGSRRALSVIDEADKLIDAATGSYLGTGIDLAARGVGASTPGANAIAQLKALEGSLMMNQPRMEGPQSNLDVALYRQMAGQIGDPTVPRAQKKAALETIRGLHKKYLSDLGVPSGGATGGWSITEVK